MTMTRREMSHYVDATLSILNDVVGLHERSLLAYLDLSINQWITIRSILRVGGWIDVNGSIVTLTGSGRSKANRGK